MDKTIIAEARRENITGRYEYQLVANLQADVAQKVMDEKELFRNVYNFDAAVMTRPHIGITHFQASEGIEDTLVRWLQRIVGEQRSFAVTLNNYSGIPPHTVFLRIQDPEPFRSLAIQLRPIDELIRSNAWPAPHFDHAPFLSIAMQLPLNVYERAITDYSAKLFHESFNVTELQLLRREHAQDLARQVAVFRLQPIDHYAGN